jgi:hypothetical protein
MSSHRANVRCADNMVHDVRVWRTATAACGVVIFDLPSDAHPTLLGSRTRIVRAAQATDGTGPTTKDSVDCMACVVGLDRTPYAVLCDDHGQQFLTEHQYNLQINRPDARWRCPRCGEDAYWDDDEYEATMDFDGPGLDD